MSEIKRMARDFSQDCVCVQAEHSVACVEAAYETGFRKAIELATDRFNNTRLDPTGDGWETLQELLSL